MNIFRLALELFALYLLYKLVFDFIIPVAQTTKQVKKQFGEMQSRMNTQAEQFNQQQNTQATGQSKPSAAPKERAEDYIDFEEVK